jgi:uncharacterized membrane protein
MLSWFLAVAAVVVVAIVLPILSFVRLRSARRRLDALENAQRDLTVRLDRLAKAAAGPGSAVAPTPPPVEPVAAAGLSSAASSWLPPEQPLQIVHPPAAPAPLVAAVAAEGEPTLESEIGSRVMLVVGTIVLVLGVAFFVKYAFDNQWIDETARVGIGTVAGAASWIAGVWLARRGYVRYGRVVAGGGLAMIFLSAYAAYALYALLPAAAAFAWMAAASAMTAVTADREGSSGLALIAVALAYAVPFLVANDADHHVAFFVYNASIAGAAFVLARRHHWPLLVLASFLFAWVAFSAWAAPFYRPPLFVSAEIYLTVVSALFVALLPHYLRAADPLARLTVAALWCGPVLYHAASVAILFDHSAPFLVYLITVTAAGIAVAAAYRSTVARLLLWGLVAPPFFSWLTQHAAGPWYLAVTATAGAIYLLHFSAEWRALEEQPRAGSPEIVLFHLNGLGLFGFTYLAVDAHAGSTAALAFALSVWHAALARAFRGLAGDMVPHALALAFTFLAMGIAISLTGPWVTVTWAAEGAAIVWIGLTTRRAWLRHGGTALIAIATARLVALEFAETSVNFTLFANRRTATGAFIVALMYGVAALYRRHAADAPDANRRWAAGWVVAANTLTVGLLTADISSFWSVRGERLSASFARQLTISVTWAAYAMALIAIGFRRQSAPLRYLALALFGVTVAKMFAVDLLTLDGVYRITGFVVMGIVLLAASFLYQRAR